MWADPSRGLFSEDFRVSNSNVYILNPPKFFIDLHFIWKLKGHISFFGKYLYMYDIFLLDIHKLGETLDRPVATQIGYT